MARQCEKYHQQWESLKSFSKRGGWDMLARAINPNWRKYKKCGDPPKYPNDKKSQITLTR